MPMIPDDMDACHRKTIKEQAEKRLRAREDKRKQAKLKSQIDALQKAYPDATIYFCEPF